MGKPEKPLVKGSVSDPDPEWIRIRWATDSGSGSIFGIRIRIQVSNFA